MEVFRTEQYYIFTKLNKSLWWNRSSGAFNLKTGCDLSSVEDIECVGTTVGIVGVISLAGVYDPHLIVIKESVPVGVLFPPHTIYKIKSIVVFGAEEVEDILIPCNKHATGKIGTSSKKSQPKGLFDGSVLVNKTWGAVKSAGTSIKSTTQQAAAIASSQMKSSVVGRRDPGRIEKRVTEELHKIFDDTDSFYYSDGGDLTCNMQRQGEGKSDERFFWNKHMLKDIIELNDQSWVLPVIQGFVQIEECEVAASKEKFKLALVSRRSRFRAGTRYKRRGVDELGHVANYVETEQVLSFMQHQMSFTVVRGSVPVYWSQPGYKYRPPPRIDRDDAETQVAFESHFEQELSTYGPVCIINLVEQCGKEGIIWEAFNKHTLAYNNPFLTYVTFDFHEYCRGMHFENVSILLNALVDHIHGMGYCWRDNRGNICTQQSVFRVNCMDCLDRTNVVQTALGKAVLESQLSKLGLIPPGASAPPALRAPFQSLWANNGDIISRQYAGTNALKGDYTRTGERKISGIMKDGMNSANRYYLSRFKDSYRQATIDMMLGNTVTAESLNALGGDGTGTGEVEAEAAADHARQLVDDCRRLLLGEGQLLLGAWGLIDASPSTGDPNETEVDCILLLTNEFYLVAEYDLHLDKVTRFEKIPLGSLTLIELGAAPNRTGMSALSTRGSNMFKSSSSVAPMCIRLSYKTEDSDNEFYHMFRSANLRFFNNVAVVIRTKEEMLESLNTICECFLIALEAGGFAPVPLVSGNQLVRRKDPSSLLSIPNNGIPRNLSETQLLSIGSKALTNMTEQFSKIGQTFTSKKQSSRAKFRLGKTSSQQSNDVKDSAGKSEDSSSESEGENNIYQPGETTPVDPKVYENEFLPSVGIVMGNSDGTNVLADKESMIAHSSDVNNLLLSSVMDNVTINNVLSQTKSDSVDDTEFLSTSPNITNSSPYNRSPTPEITVQSECDGHVRNHAQINQKFSHSSGEVDANIATGPTVVLPQHAASSRSDRDLSLNLSLSGSQSENALKQLKVLTSPIGGGLSKLAKGMQSIGANLDPRKINVKSALQPRTTEHNNEQQKKLQEKWMNCKTKLIAL
ncbi:phosphatidylinositide phosphatase SAC2 isoform X2 [Ctenocephalides felis]|uniref:phosphatidylinositide phosphatase SAC2 isoform X2 n=1 Tax=Ctenocephalides felis TaxID=7515 RepID=UPI000E6E26C8|nr:phosphatidylinositide phosphatase SAC2 isoform X2 [Ctenocephalides felis]